MDAVLTIDQLKRELDSVRAENLRMRQDLHDVRNINDQLKKKNQQDREWIAHKLEIISRNQIQGTPGFPGPCYCGLAAVLEQAKRRAAIDFYPGKTSSSNRERQEDCRMFS